mmetsp:Transcript_4565/g.6912  ORF Transcript_4565/g.6912 Transcript_4565/m.6912 type:complete len:130 (-) Transcript_4565:2568-2957(-)
MDHLRFNPHEQNTIDKSFLFDSTVASCGFNVYFEEHDGLNDDEAYTDFDCGIGTNKEAYIRYEPATYLIKYSIESTASITDHILMIKYIYNINRVEDTFTDEIVLQATFLHEGDSYVYELPKSGEYDVK